VRLSLRYLLLMAMRSTAFAVLLFALFLVSPFARAAEDDGSVPGWLGSYHPELAARMTFALGSEVPGNFPLTGGGFGVRGGLSYRGFYGGLTYMDYFTDGGCLSGGFNDSCWSTHGLSFGAEAGYGHTFFRVLTLRAILGVGDYATLTTATDSGCTFNSSSATAAPPPTCTSSSSNSSTHTLYLQPEGLVEVSLGPVILGVDGSVFTMPGSSQGAFAAFMMGVQAGARL
jgi:hypothetical protein